MPNEMDALNKARTERFRKSKREESFLEEFNNYLFHKERKEYEYHPIEHPFIFVVGLPRSGTTLTSQIIASALDIGFINNLAARFYLAPLHGIRFSKTVLGDRGNTDYESSYAKTSRLEDIHEFGYFWRHWLKKRSLEDIANAKDLEDSIDWNGLKNCLSAIQREFNRGLVFKNMYGAYHINRLEQLLEQVLYIYVERDELDTACSILQARKQYYGENLDMWWSYAPPEVLELKKLDYRDQIAGQIVLLKKFFDREFKNLGKADNVIRLTYESLCNNPKSLVDTVRDRASSLFGYEFNRLNPAPASFECKVYDQRDTKEMFKKRINTFRTETGRQS